VVKWEHTSGDDLGLVLGKPVIARLNDGSDVAIFGNGYNSTNENAVLYIVNLASGEIRTIRTSNETSNGLGTPKGWDADGNGTIDIVYAGDLLGNVWKFDLGATDSADWKLAYKLFQARDAGGKAQPITGGIGLGINSVVGHPSYGKLYLFFGTGRYLTYTVTATDVLSDATDNSVQTWYGLIDNPPLEPVSPLIGSRSELKARTITTQTTLSGKTVRTFSSATQGDMAGKKGWYIDLLTPPGGVAEGERMIGDSAQFAGTLIASSIIPSTGNDCFPTGRGFVNAIDPFTGGNLTQLFFDVNGDGFFDAGDMVDGKPVGSVDLGIGMPGNPVIIGDRLVVGGSSGEMASMQIRSTLQNRRLSWREVQR
jgi:type IV pilus assembly protein PilY1